VNIIKKLIGLVLLFVLMGCASVPMGDTKQDASLKNFSSVPDKAGLYVYRNELFGGAVKMDVELDGKPMGITVAKTFLFKELSSGKHTITSKAENSDTIELNAQPGKLYFIWQEAKMGFLYARTQLHLVDEATGQKGVNETKLAESK
jgi:hypothetical protein